MDVLYDTLPIIDLEMGKRLAGNKEALAKEMLDLLKQSLMKDVQEITAAFERHNLQETMRLVHRLHGAVSYCGTPQLKAIIADLETALRNKLFDRIEPLYDLLLVAAPRVMSAVIC